MGHVFHPGHDALHGMTVVVVGTAGRHYLGRYHEATEQGLVLHDVGILEPGGPETATEWIAKQRKFGVRAQHRSVTVPSGGYTRVVRLADW
jgi:hypothetical protein